MDKTHELASVASRLSEDQVTALINLARAMSEPPFYDQAPSAALASLDRGLAQLERGETVSLDQLSQRLRQAVE